MTNIRELPIFLTTMEAKLDELLPIYDNAILELAKSHSRSQYKKVQQELAPSLNSDDEKEIAQLVDGLKQEIQARQNAVPPAPPARSRIPVWKDKPDGR